MISGEVMQSKLTTTVKTDIPVAPKQEFILEWWIKSIFMDLAITGNDARQSQHGSLAAAIYSSTHLEDSTTERPDDQVFHQQRCRLFSS